VKPSTERQVGVPDGNLVLDLFLLQQRIGELMELALRGTETRPSEYAVYSQLAIGPMTPRELSARLGMTPSTLTGHLDALARRQHVARSPNPQDGRSYRVELTADGLAEVARCRQGFRHMLKGLRGQLPVPEPEVRAVLRMVDEAAGRAAAQLRATQAPLDSSTNSY
jgi:DNA-binding MarR family transcriptional regulator